MNNHDCIKLNDLEVKFKHIKKRFFLKTKMKRPIMIIADLIKFTNRENIRVHVLRDDH